MDFIALSNKSSHLIPIIITAAICRLCHLNINICCFGALDGNSFRCWGGGGGGWVGERRVYRGLRFISDVIKSFAMDISYLDQSAHLWVTVSRIKERRGEDSRYWTFTSWPIHTHVLSMQQINYELNTYLMMSAQPQRVNVNAWSKQCWTRSQDHSCRIMSPHVSVAQQPQSFVGNPWVNTNLWTVEWSMLI